MLLHHVCGCCMVMHQCGLCMGVAGTGLRHCAVGLSNGFMHPYVHVVWLRCLSQSMVPLAHPLQQPALLSIPFCLCPAIACASLTPCLSTAAACVQVRPSERISAAQQLPALEARLCAELAEQGIDPEEAAHVRRGMHAGQQGGGLQATGQHGEGQVHTRQLPGPVTCRASCVRWNCSAQKEPVAPPRKPAACSTATICAAPNHPYPTRAQCWQVEDDSLLPEGGEVQETGFVDEDGQLRRPWCPATRILEHREAAAEAAAAEAKRRAAQEVGAGLLGAGELEAPLRTGFPELVEGQPIFQKNEGEGRKG